MTNLQIKTPILFIIFNRPSTTKKVFEEIRKIKPKKLYIVADGPREWKAGDDELCQETRNIVDGIDWPCEVFKNFSDKNIGCKNRVSSGIDWFFEHEERGIILEDDCLPSKSFFYFCEEMLNRYQDNERIGMISGNNFQFGKIKNDASYYFSKYSHIWGWATWRRAWKKYDVNIREWKSNKGVLKKTFPNDLKSQIYWKMIFSDVYSGEIDTWDYQWTYTCFANNFISVMPSVNLVSNIGFSDSDSTHTKRKDKFSEMVRYELNFPLKHPRTIEVNNQSDILVRSNNYPFFRFFISRFLRKLRILK
jgi:hypothetical protein